MSEPTQAPAPCMRPRDGLILGAAIVATWGVMMLMAAHGVRLQVIPALSMLAIKHLRHNDGERHEPKHRAVRFLVDAWNTGYLDEAESYIADDCAVVVNGSAYDTGRTTDGVFALRQCVQEWRAMLPDLKMELLVEVEQEGRIALEAVITGTRTGTQPNLPATGNAVELRIAVFLTLDRDRITDIATLFDGPLAIAVGAANGRSASGPWALQRSLG